MTRSISRPSLGVLTALMLLSLTGAPARADSVHAFAWSQQSTGTFEAEGRYRQHDGGAVEIQRTQAGAYTVRFEGLGGSAGNVLVSAYGRNGARCQVVSFYPSQGDQYAKVRCHVGTTPTDTLFSISYVRVDDPTGRAGLAYLWGGSTSTTPIAPIEYQYSSNGGTHTVSRVGVGNYLVTLAGQSDAGGTVGVSAYGSLGQLCTTGGWWGSAGRTIVAVRCFDSSGRPSESMFTLRYQSADPMSTSDAFAYAYADRHTTSSYVPDARWTFAVGETSIQAHRYGPGSYAVDLPGVYAARGVPLVTAYASAAVTCKPSSWMSRSEGVRVFVQCVDVAGVATDARYAISFRNGTNRYRVAREATPRSRPTLSTWEGILAGRLPTLGSRVSIPLRTGVGTLWDVWYRNEDGSLSKVLVDRDRVRRGTFTLRADGSSATMVDLDGDELIDVVETFSPDGEHRFLASESHGIEAMERWLAGTSPLCNGLGPDRLTVEDITSGSLPGCNLRGVVDRAREIGGWAAPYAADGIVDPMDMLCAGITHRPPGFEGATHAVDFVGPTADAIKEVLNNGFDGQRDSDGVRFARVVASPLVVGYALLMAFYTESLVTDGGATLLSGACRAQASCREAETAPETEAETETETETETGTEGGEEPPPEGETSGGTDTTGGTTELPSAEDSLPEILVSACQSRRDDTRGRDRWRGALAPECTDPAAASGVEAVCVSRDELERVDVMHPQLDADRGCDLGDPGSSVGCEPASVADRLRWLEFAGLEGVEICNPIVCDPGF